MRRVSLSLIALIVLSVGVSTKLREFKYKVLRSEILMAEISGTVINDANKNGVEDAGESGLQGWTVFLDQNANGIFDSGEVSTTTDADGNYTFTNLAPDTYIVAQVVQNGWQRTFPTIAPTSKFNIDIVFADNNLTEADRKLVTDAANTWEKVIIGDLSNQTNVTLPSGKNLAFVDDLVIEVSAKARGDEFLAEAGPDEFRDNFDSGLPYVGSMEINSDEIEQMKQEGSFESTILHEMGHALGIGTLWEDLDLVTGAGTNNPRYIGENAIVQYNSIFNNSETSIPVANTGGEGTRDIHWHESVFQTELMSGFDDPGVKNPLSRITAASLIDLGYEVDLRFAEDYTAPGNTPSNLNTSGVAAPGGTHLVTVSPTEVVTDLNFGNFENFLTSNQILTKKGEVTVENLEIELPILYPTP